MSALPLVRRKSIAEQMVDMATTTDALAFTRWCSYGVSLCSALFTIVTGALAARSDGWVFSLIAFYTIWIFSFGVFTYANATAKNDFILRYLYYFLCVGATLFFFSEVGGVRSSFLHFYIPISSNIGVFLGVGLSQTFSSTCSTMSWSRIRRHIHNSLCSLEHEVLPRWEQELAHWAGFPARPVILCLTKSEISSRYIFSGHIVD
ncbi:hypothetical protein GJ744_000272 [Endocarpon pusillum]|uniref:Uncharacterized protein n=1 Tax=Endocarpon pusillum TaxID=364733 RepID=A0A8H7AX43_9EURO|nr:hypothetical protein GJ744_000272 [Endocarpon pusillum]